MPGALSAVNRDLIIMKESDILGVIEGKASVRAAA